MSSFKFNPFTGEFDIVGVSGADSDAIEAIVNREIDSGFDSVSGSIHQFVDGIIAAELQSGGAISDAIDSDAIDKISLELDSGGLIKIAINNALAGAGLSTLTNPSFTYTSGLLTRVDYSGGEYKTLTYDSNDQLTSVYDGTTTKTLTYNTDGTLASVSET